MEKTTKKSSKKIKEPIQEIPKVIEQKKETPKVIEKVEEKETYVKNEISDIINGYVKTNTQFRIYFRNQILFDTKNKLKKEYPKFNQNDFIIGENKYIYKGIRIEIY